MIREVINMFENKNKDLNDNNRIDDDMMQEVCGGECQENSKPGDPSAYTLPGTGEDDDRRAQGMSRNQNGNLHLF
jgi:hypothetical protein